MATTSLLKIKLDISPKTAEYIRLQEQWENEGGAITVRSDVKPALNIPLQPGEHFKVVGGHIHFEDGSCYYIAEVEKLKAGIT
jgi:hypothetical protein